MSQLQRTSWLVAAEHSKAASAGQCTDNGRLLGWCAQGTARPPGQDELQPEGNGTGFLWDDSGNVVTNYHVLQSALAAMGRRPGAQRARQGGQVVAKITLLGE